MSNRNSLRRELGLFDAVSIIVGIMIGSGIFFIPTFVLQRAGAPGLALLVWVAAGVISILSGLCYAELGAAMPVAGGSYVYLREAFGPLVAFTSTWSGFLVGGPGSIAALAVAFGTYLGFFWPLSNLGLKLVAIVTVVFLTAINILGVRQGARLQNVLTAAKIIPILAICLFGLARGQAADFTPLLPAGSSWSASISAFGLALIAALWAFTGWANINSLAEELKNPARNLPLAIILGVGGVTLLYGLFNFALLNVLPATTLGATETPAAAVAVELFGKVGGVVIAGGALISILGSCNGCILAFPRNYFAMARDSLFFPQLAAIHPKLGTPVVSLVVSAALSIVLILTGTFEQLTTLVVFSGMIYTTLAIAAVFVLRLKQPDLHRPYRVWGYPYVPIFVLLFNMGLMLNTLIEDPRSSIVGLLVPALGIPAYYYFQRKKDRAMGKQLTVELAHND
ncbi:MAG: amino acid permease [Firmicutes bacterium]|nr:amino acid permease [Bacillota bacterium]